MNLCLHRTEISTNHFLMLSPINNSRLGRICFAISFLLQIMFVLNFEKPSNCFFFSFASEATGDTREKLGGGFKGVER